MNQHNIYFPYVLSKDFLSLFEVKVFVQVYKPRAAFENDNRANDNEIFTKQVR